MARRDTNNAHGLLQRKRHQLSNKDKRAPPASNAQPATYTVTNSPDAAPAGSTVVVTQPRVVTVTQSPAQGQAQGQYSTTVYVQVTTVGAATPAGTANGAVATTVVVVPGPSSASSSAAVSVVVPSGFTLINNTLVAVPTLSSLPSSSALPPSSAAALLPSTSLTTIFPSSSASGAGALANAGGVTNAADGGLGTGAIVGIAVGCFAAVVALIALIVYFASKMREDDRNGAMDMMGPSNLPDPYSTAYTAREVPASFVQFDGDDATSYRGPTSPTYGDNNAHNVYDEMAEAPYTDRPASARYHNAADYHY
jgi:hypothetical protein